MTPEDLHRCWCGWMEYMFAMGTQNADETWTMPAWMVTRWTKKMRTPFEDLTEEDQKPYRMDVDGR